MKILYIVPIIVLLVFLYYLISNEDKAQVDDQLPAKFARYQSLDSPDVIKSGKVALYRTKR